VSLGQGRDVPDLTKEITDEIIQQTPFGVVWIRWVLRVWKSRPNRGRERGMGKRERKEALGQDRVDSGSTGRLPRTERHANEIGKERKSK
jgi:hypothetical protein